MNMEKITSLWNELDKDIKHSETKMSDPEKAFKAKSGLLLERLGRNIRYGLYWNMFFLAVLPVVAIWHGGQPDILCLVGLMFLLLLAGLLYCGRYYLKIRKESFFTRDTKSMLISYYQSILKMLHFERVWAQFTIPVSLIAGILYSGLVKYGSFSNLIWDSNVLIIAAVLMVSLVPLVILWVSWGQKYIFKNDLEALREQINELESCHCEQD